MKELACWKEKRCEFRDRLVSNASLFNFPIHKPIISSAMLSETFMTANQWFEGLNDFFRQLEEQTYRFNT